MVEQKDILDSEVIENLAYSVYLSDRSRVRGYLMSGTIIHDLNMVAHLLIIKTFHSEKASHIQFTEVNRPPNCIKQDDDLLIEQLS